MMRYEKPEIKFLKTELSEGIAANCWNAATQPGSNVTVSFDPTNDFGSNPTISRQIQYSSADCSANTALTSSIIAQLQSQWGPTWDGFAAEIGPNATDVFTEFLGLFTIRVINVSP